MSCNFVPYLTVRDVLWERFDLEQMSQNGEVNLS